MAFNIFIKVLIDGIPKFRPKERLPKRAVLVVRGMISLAGEKNLTT